MGDVLGVFQKHLGTSGQPRVRREGYGVVPPAVSPRQSRDQAAPRPGPPPRPLSVKGMPTPGFSGLRSCRSRWRMVLCLPFFHDTWQLCRTMQTLSGAEVKSSQSSTAAVGLSASHFPPGILSLAVLPPRKASDPRPKLLFCGVGFPIFMGHVHSLHQPQIPTAFQLY